MSSGQGHAPRVGAQHFKFDAQRPLASGVGHNREFQRGVVQSGNEIIAREIVQQHLHARYGFLKCGKGRRQYLHGGTCA